MAEWSNAAVLKTVEGHTSGGSNPSSSAKETRNESCGFCISSSVEYLYSKADGDTKPTNEVCEGFMLARDTPSGITLR